MSRFQPKETRSHCTVSHCPPPPSACLQRLSRHGLLRRAAGQLDFSTARSFCIAYQVCDCIKKGIRTVLLRFQPAYDVSSLLLLHHCQLVVELLNFILVDVINRLDPQPGKSRVHGLPCKINALINKRGDVVKLKGPQGQKLLFEFFNLFEKRRSSQIMNLDCLIDMGFNFVILPDEPLDAL